MIKIFHLQTRNIWQYRNQLSELQLEDREIKFKILKNKGRTKIQSIQLTIISIISQKKVFWIPT